MRINRFPKMAALQKFRALKLGYPEEEAEAIGIAEAVKYAIFKRLAHSERKYREAERKKFTERYKDLDWEKYSVFKLAALDGKPFVAGKVYTPFDYKREIFIKWGDEVGQQIEQWAKRIIENVPEKILRDEQKFFKLVWVPHRDDPIIDESTD
ncbi:MAG: hypothetical protein GXO48_04545 [Chlorobi bacterium]|nr:hypothetical protein [Chlorobiota bacterium]